MSKRRIIIIIIFIIMFIIGIIFSSYYYKDKYTVIFKLNKDDIYMIKYVKKGEVLNEIDNPSLDGYLFKEWQYESNTFNFDTEINSDMVIYAKFIKEKYINISFETGTKDEIGNISLLSGEVLTNLPDLCLEGYKFIGWYYNDVLYTNQKLYKDTTLKAKFEPIYNIGDKVIITGFYSNSSISSVAEYNFAYGWERVIVDILDDANYKYAIGYENEILGFFNEDGFIKVN